jgi:hypothetical protein
MKTPLVICLVLASALDARAGCMLGRSLEWLTDTAQSIGVYTVTSVESKTPDNPSLDRVYYSLELKLKESIKGKPPANVKYGYEENYFVVKEKSVAQGDLFLVFRGVIDKDEPLQAVHVISLEHPGGVLDSSMALAMNAKFEALTDGGAILRTVRDRMAAHPGTYPAQDGRAAVDITQSPAFNGIELDDGYVLLVPPDLRPELVAPHELWMIVTALRSWYGIHHSMPSGGPAQIVKALCSVNFLPPDVLTARANAKGEYLDPWGTPYRIDASNPKFPWAYSCGPDKKDDGGAPGSDDIVSW